MGISDSFEDFQGYMVEIGTIVGFREEYGMSEMELMDGRTGLSYIVNSLPDLGHMVNMTEVVHITAMLHKGVSGEDSFMGSKWVPAPNARMIQVEPYKIGAI